MKIFYVDDEKNNLLLFKRSMPTSFEVIAFIKPKEAAAALEVQKPEVIVTDEDMPELKGLQLLEIASQVLPSSLRFLVTGKTDIDVLQKNTKPGLAHFFMANPMIQTLLLIESWPILVWTRRQRWTRSQRRNINRNPALAIYSLKQKMHIVSILIILMKPKNLAVNLMINAQICICILDLR